MPTIREAIDQFYGMMNSGDLARMDDYVARDLVDHEEMPGVTGTGSERLVSFVNLMHATFSDLHMEALDIISEGDRTAVRFRATGKHTGDGMGFPGTGKSIDIEGIDILRFENGKVVEHWGISDQAGMMMQLGLMPPGA